GIIGVMGPKRMSYSKTMGLIQHVTKEVNKVIKEISNEGDSNDR
ncbi:MAG: heat-inducible transcriptional repressor HrcA, partial [Cetobacterium sp.]